MYDWIIDSVFVLLLVCFCASFLLSNIAIIMSIIRKWDFTSLDMYIVYSMKCQSLQCKLIHLVHLYEIITITGHNIELYYSSCLQSWFNSSHDLWLWKQWTAWPPSLAPPPILAQYLNALTKNKEFIAMNHIYVVTASVFK